ncbi:PolC-type DNA polymerase III [Kitasatospora sp. NPDC051984]|uniref:PolC-type DNA polymerase III n=1 Tax=Kitasatospora sp. NPDC051984 TaxID=3364059 RepID=UPI0037CAAA67
MTGLLRDPSLSGLTLVVIDFEGLTPTGRPAEPTEVAALALRPEDGRLVEVGRFESLIRPPTDVPVTARNAAQTGITAQMLARADPSAVVMARLDAHLSAPPYRLVAHHAPTEAGMIARQAAHCPTLAATPLLDTIRLAKALTPGLGSYSLDNLLAHYGIARPADRHRAMPDVTVTALLLERLLTNGNAAGQWSTLRDLDTAAGLQPKRPPPAEQDALF